MTLVPFNKFKIAFLDWDGTFCDSRKSIYDINLTMARHYGKVMPSYEEWLMVAHPGVEPCMRSLGVTESREDINAFFHTLLVELSERGMKGGLRNPLYGGTHELLVNFRALGLPAIIISRHLHDHLVHDIEEHGLSDFFERVIGEPTGEELKKDVVIQDICKQFGVAYEDTFYLGDTVHDMLLAQKAGAVSIAVTHGYDPRSRLEDIKPNIIVDSLFELLS